MRLLFAGYRFVNERKFVIALKNFASVLFQLITSRSKTSCFLQARYFPRLTVATTFAPTSDWLVLRRIVEWMEIWDLLRNVAPILFQPITSRSKTSSYLHARNFLRLKSAAPLAPRSDWFVFSCASKRQSVKKYCSSTFSRRSWREAEGKCSEKRDAHAEMLLCALNL